MAFKESYWQNAWLWLADAESLLHWNAYASSGPDIKSNQIGNVIYVILCPKGDTASESFSGGYIRNEWVSD